MFNGYLHSKKFTGFLKILPLLYSNDRNIRIRIIITIVLIIVTSLLNLLTPIALKNVIHDLSIQHAGANNQIIMVLIAYVSLWSLSQLIARTRETFMFRVFERSVRLLGVKLFTKLNQLSFKFHTNKKTGAITNIIDRAQSGIPNLFWGMTFLIIPTMIEVMIAITILWYLYGILYGMILLAIFLIFTIFSYIGGNIVNHSRRMSNEKSKAASAFIVDKISNFESLKYFSDIYAEVSSCDELLKAREDFMTKQLVYANIIGAMQVIILSLGFALLTILTGEAVSKGTLTIADFVLINGYLLLFIVPLNNFGVIFQQIRQGMTDLEDVVNILEIEPDNNNLLENAIIQNDHSLVFKNVHFSYTEEKRIFDNLCFEIPSGKTIAIVGPSGTGKSTLIKLLFRFYEVNAGTIFIGGQAITNYSQETLKNIIGIVPQETKLFNDTLYYNLTYGLKSKISKNYLDEVIFKAHLKDFINQLPAGLNTLIGENGVNLSGGEKQRIAIARVLLKNPCIYIFDEATSALDSSTEIQIQHNLDEISKDKTTLIITHRLSTVTNASIIFVINNGKIAEKGNHEELLNAKGIYAMLYQQQTNRFESKIM